MKSGDPKVSGFQRRFSLRSSLSIRLLHHIVSPKHGWVSFNSAVNVSFCWILSEINWKCCGVFLLLYRRGGQPVTLEPSATPAFLLLRLPACPAAGLGSDRPPGIWG